MKKKVLNIIELLLIVLIILSVLGFYQPINSISRFFTTSDSLRVGIDIIIIVTLLLRALQIIKNFKKNHLELGQLKILEKVLYVIGIISLFPDLTTWYQWNYFANMYLHIFIIFSLPIIFWTIEITERI